MPGERSGFARHALHQVAVAAHGVDIEIEKLEAGSIVVSAQPLAGNGHPHAVAATLPERTSSRLDAGGQVRFRVARSLAVNLAKALYLFHRYRRLAAPSAIHTHSAHAA